MCIFITQDTPVSDAVLNVIAHLPTKSLAVTVDSAFFQKLTDADFMRIAVLLAQKGYEEGGCPIGVVVGNITSASGNEDLIRSKGIEVDILEDQVGIDLYSQYRSEKPKQDIEDWKGLAALHG
ncbi:MAG: hypothetical protein RBR86_03315 [Pseudobdellovibrionaceae bacterium]|nr:hypothetical protein [Pseudobdellovibrionaceae bacterium]